MDSKTRQRMNAIKSPNGIKVAPTSPVWAGPEDSGPQGGVTQSLLSRFLMDRERFRLYVVNGMKAKEGFSHRLFYGNAFHLCEEAEANGNDWHEALGYYASKVCREYPLATTQVIEWRDVCATQFPLYVQYWEEQNKRNRNASKVTTLLSEQVFNVPYPLPSGRTVMLRGKWDSVCLIDGGIFIKEMKTKGTIDERKIQRQLVFDLQAMFYMVALAAYQRSSAYADSVTKMIDSYEIEGVEYDVIRRPLSGGKGTIRPHKPTKKNPSGESSEEFYKRLADIIREDPEYYFMRWTVPVTNEDIAQFRRQFLDPILEQLCNWWDWTTKHEIQYKYAVHGIHYRMPYGCKSLDLSQEDAIDEFLNSGSTMGLTTVETLFPEL